MGMTYIFHNGERIALGFTGAGLIGRARVSFHMTETRKLDVRNWLALARQVHVYILVRAPTHDPFPHRGEVD